MLFSAIALDEAENKLVNEVLNKSQKQDDIVDSSDPYSKPKINIEDDLGMTTEELMNLDLSYLDDVQ